MDSEDYWDVFYYVTDRVFDEFKKNNITIPYNQLEVRLRNDEVPTPVYKDELPTRVEKVRTEEVEGDFIDQLIQKQQKRNRILREKKKNKKKEENKIKKENETKVSTEKLDSTEDKKEDKVNSDKDKK